MDDRARRRPLAVFHVGIDDRVTLADVNSDQKAVGAGPFLTTAVVYDASFRLGGARVMINNRSGSKACALPRCLPGAGLRHIRANAQTVKPNGKPELSAQREWADA
jgi:hypothetical protein